MAKFTEEELKNLSNLIISIDNKNVTLGLSILNNSKEQTPVFSNELALVAALNDSTELKKQATDLLEEHFSLAQRKEWTEGLSLLLTGSTHHENNQALQDLVNKHEAFRPKVQPFIEQHSGYAHRYYKIGRHFHLTIKAHLKLAESYYRIFLESNPNDETCLYCLAYLLADAAESAEEAKDLYEKIYSINPKSHGAVNNIGHIYDVYYKDYENAFLYYEKALKIGPKESRYMRNLSKLYKKLKPEGYLKKAKKMLEKAIEVEPEIVGNWKDLGDFQWEHERDYEAAKKSYEIGLQKEPDNQMLLSNMGELNFFVLKDYELALSFFRKALYEKETWSTLALTVTLLVDKIQNLEEAKTYYLYSLEVPDRPTQKPSYFVQSKWDNFLAAELKLKEHFQEL